MLCTPLEYLKNKLAPRLIAMIFQVEPEVWKAGVTYQTLWEESLSLVQGERTNECNTSFVLVPCYGVHISLFM